MTAAAALERPDLGDGYAVDRDDDALARARPADDGGDVVAQLADPDSFHEGHGRPAVARVYT